jgi:hypothetical protein
MVGKLFGVGLGKVLSGERTTGIALGYALGKSMFCDILGNG